MDVLEVIETYSLQQLKSSNKSCKMYSDKKRKKLVKKSIKAVGNTYNIIRKLNKGDGKYGNGKNL